MRATPLTLAGLVLIEPPVAADDRGHFFESYHREKFGELGIDEDFVQDNQSRSVCGVLRGLHAQLHSPQGKLVRVVSGRIFDVAVDIRPDSPTFGRWESVELSGDEARQLWIPVGFAHGFCVLSEAAEVFYKCTDLYDPGDEIGIRWDDAAIGIEWPIEQHLVSPKDPALPTLAELEPRLRAASQETPE